MTRLASAKLGRLVLDESRTDVFQRACLHLHYTIPAHNRRSTHISSRCIAALQLIDDDDDFIGMAANRLD